jgi:hypothetical protein
MGIAVRILRAILPRLALTSCVLLGACAKGEIPESDRPLLVTLDELEDYGFKLSHLADRQVFSRSRYLDGSLEIEYEFETPDDAPDVLYVSVTAGFERSVLDAIQSYRLQKGGIGVGLKLGDTKIQEKKEFYQWGDESFFADIMGKNGPAGNVFGTRLGKKTYWFMVAGLYFEDRSQWEEFIAPKLRYLETYDPLNRREER